MKKPFHSLWSCSDRSHPKTLANSMLGPRGTWVGLRGDEHEVRVQAAFHAAPRGTGFYRDPSETSRLSVAILLLRSVFEVFAHVVSLETAI
jgi:hypothetical protein